MKNEQKDNKEKNDDKNKKGELQITSYSYD